MKFLSDILAKAGLTVDGVVTLNNTATGQTPNANDNSTKLATTAWVRTFVQPYSLPIASASVLGGIKVGSGLSIDAGTGVLSASGSGGTVGFRTIQEFTATASQDTFTISGGYTAGYVEVFLNGVYLSESQYTATNGTTVVLDDPAAHNDLVTVFLYSLYYTGQTTASRDSVTLTATAGQTVFTTPYIPGQVDVYYNGSKLVSTEFTATNGSTITLAQAAVAGDLIEVVTHLVTGGVNSNRTLTINGVSYDLSQDRSWTISTGTTLNGTGFVKASGTTITYDNSTYATETYVSTQINNLINGAPGLLDTLDELAAALGDDANFASTVTTSIGTKVPQARTITINGTAYDLSADRSWTIASGVTSFNTRTGAITLTSGDVTDALGFTPYNATNPSGYITGITSGMITTALGYTPVTNARTITINGTSYDLSADRSWSIAAGVTSFNTRTGDITPASGDYTTAQVTESGNLYYTNTRARLSISLTTTGTSGAATYDSATGVFNIPQYQGGVTSFNTRTGAITLSSGDVTTALGYTPVTNARTITINGTTYDLSANRSWTIAPDTSVRNIYTFTATASQTTFTVDGGYTVGLVDVFINGVKLSTTDFTATNGTTVVLATGTGVNNIVEIVKYVSAFTTAVENTRTLTINGTTYDLSANRTWSITNASLGAQPQLNGTGLVRMSGTTVSYDNATYATESYVTTAVANLVNSAPSTLDTLNELSAALGNDANFATTVTNSIATKLALSGGTLTGALNGTTITLSSWLSIGGGSEGLRLGNVGDNSAYDNVKLYYTGYNSGSPRVYLTPRQTPGSGVVNTFLHLQNTNGTSTASNNTMGLIVDGAIGIRTVPSYLLDVYTESSGSTSTVFRLKNGYNDTSTGIRMRWDFASLAGAYLDVTTNSGGSKSMTLYLSSANATPSQVLLISGDTGAATFSNTVSANTFRSVYFDMPAGTGYNAFQMGVDSFSGGWYVYDATNSSYRFKISNSGSATFSGSLTVGSSLNLSAPIYSSSVTPFTFSYNGNTDTYTQTTIYVNQNNTSGDTANGIFIERGKLSNSGGAETRHFIIGARGGSIQWRLDGNGNGTYAGNISGADIYSTGGLRYNGAGLNASDKKLYSPTDGELQWMTHSSAGAHAFSISHQGTRQVYLDVSGNSYLNGGNTGFGTTSPSHRVHVSGNIYSTDTVFGRNLKPEAFAGPVAGTPTSAGVPMGYSTINISSPCDNQWRAIMNNLNDTKGYFWVTLGDAASKDTANYFMSFTSPAYGVSNFGAVSYQDNGWNTGGFEFTYDTAGPGGTYRLLVRCTSYYNSANTAYGTIYFLRLE